MHQQYKDRAEFLFIYIQEAHPSDEWQMESNEDAGVVLSQPTKYGERRDVAQSCTAALSLSMTCVVDDMDNTVDQLYAGWPERLFVVDTDGRIAYAGAVGPFGFEPDEVGAWLRKNLGKP